MFDEFSFIDLFLRVLNVAFCVCMCFVFVLFLGVSCVVFIFLADVVRVLPFFLKQVHVFVLLCSAFDVLMFCVACCSYVYVRFVCALCSSFRCFLCFWGVYVFMRCFVNDLCLVVNMDCCFCFIFC